MATNPQDKTAPASAITPAAQGQAGPLATVEQLNAAIEALASACNVLVPMAAVDSVLPMHQVSIRAVKVDSAVDQYGNGPECYRDRRFCRDNEVALGKGALVKIMAAGGVEVTKRTRVDDRSDPYYAEVEVELAVRDFDGHVRRVLASKEVDLRDGAPETLKPEKDGQGRKTGKVIPYDDSALADKRRHILSLAETKAIERGLRLLFPIRQKYTLAELEKPFAVPKLVPALDPSDPEQKQALIALAMGANVSLYGPPGIKHVGEVEVQAREKRIESEPAQQPEPVSPELEMPPADEPEPPAKSSGLPITEATMNACPTNDEARYKQLDCLMHWQAYAVKRLGVDRAGTLLAELGQDFDALAAPLAEIVAVYQAIKQATSGGAK